MRPCARACACRPPRVRPDPRRVVRRTKWPASTGVVNVDGGAPQVARFLVMACGRLSTPNRPDLPGLATFAGPVHQIARWPQAAVDFSGQRVAVLGTGSSGVQAIPLIVRQARQFTVFQRSPSPTGSWAVPAHNGPLDAGYEARIKADDAGFRARNLRMRGGFGSDLPPNAAAARSAI